MPNPTIRPLLPLPRTGQLRLLAACMMLCPSIALADGLLYQMPRDGAWVKYDLSMQMQAGDQKMIMTGSIQMSAVGTVKENDKTLRWIEFHMVMKLPGQNDAGGERAIIAKVLVPEDQLKKGGKPMDHWARGWLQQGEGEAEALKADDLGPMPAFLAGPLSDAKDLDKKETETKLGKLECKGTSGVTTYDERPTRKAIATFEEIRLHEKAPFGVVSAVLNYQSVQENGAPRDRGTMKLKLIDLGDDAKTMLPDKK